MDFHLEHQLRLHVEEKNKSLYRWAINEIDSRGKKVGADQIPWNWTLNFTATSCVLGDSINVESNFQRNEEKPAPSKITQRQFIQIKLQPGHPRDNNGDFNQTSFSMFGTNRIINSFQLDIYPISEPDEQERCSAWGSVSYTTEIDFRNETMEDCVIFYLFVKPETFARYGAKVAHGLVDEIVLSVKGVGGFYSEWSPEISTPHVKVLTRGEEHRVAFPEGLKFDVPRLGYVEAADLSISRRLDFAKPSPAKR